MTDIHAAIEAAIAEDEYWAKLAAQSLVRVNVPLPHGEHIERHGPSRVLRQVEAYRRILARHRPAGTLRGPGYSPNGFTWCTTCGSGEPNEYPRDWPCDDYRDLASIYGIEVD